MFFEGLEHRTSRFVGMRAIAKTAIAADTENLRKIMAHFLALKIYRTKTLDTRSVDNPTFAFDLRLLTFD